MGWFSELSLLVSKPKAAEFTNLIPAHVGNVPPSRNYLRISSFNTNWPFSAIYSWTKVTDYKYPKGVDPGGLR